MFKLTAKQQEANRLLGGDAEHILLEGGSRSGKTFLIVRAIAIRAMLSPGSRHAMFRLRFNHIKTAIWQDTFPKMMALCFPNVRYTQNKTDYYVSFANKSEIWFGGLDDKERTEKILGQEYATIYFNETPQIPYSSVLTARTRLAQQCTSIVEGVEKPLRLRAFYDSNPTNKAHWTYQLFHKKLDPESKKPIPDPENYATFLLNPFDNIENLPPTYIKSLEAMPERMKRRFLRGQYAETATDLLWTDEVFEINRHYGDLPDMQRVVIAVDPSGADDENAEKHDAIGIVAAGLGVDGYGYLLADATVSAGPEVWGRIAVEQLDKFAADRIIGEINYGGAMVGFVVRAARKNAPYKAITATRGKVVRAEPISVLGHKGKIRHVGEFPELEAELCEFTTRGYLGATSPNRADAYVWAFTELFHGMLDEGPKETPVQRQTIHIAANQGGWMT